MAAPQMMGRPGDVSEAVVTDVEEQVPLLIQGKLQQRFAGVVPEGSFSVRRCRLTSG